MDLKGKNAVVTGGGRGLGRAMVIGLLSEGVTVGIFDIDKKGFDELESDGFEDIYFIKCDVSDYEQTELAVNEFYSKFKKIDILINNAGILYSAPLIGLSEGRIRKHSVEMWNKVLSVDLSSVFYMTSNVVEKMIIKRTKGVIVNISSIAARGNAGQSAYSAAKAGVNALTVTWAKELGLWGIRVVGVAPGYCETDSTRATVCKEDLDEIRKEVPLRRLGRPEEIADGVISIIKNDYIHGKILEIDGGLVV